jgi:hypothetical protein
MTTDNVSKLPVDVDFDLDAAEKPQSQIRPPFRTTIEGKVVTFNDPSDADWRDLAMLDSPNEFVRLTTSPEDRRHIFETPLPGWKFNMLMEAFYRHFNLEDKIAEAKRRQHLSGA